MSAERRVEKGAACIVMSVDGKVVCMRAQHVWANINKVDEKVGKEEEVADGWNGSARVKSMRGPTIPR